VKLQYLSGNNRQIRASATLLFLHVLLISARKPGKDELGPMFTFLQSKFLELKVWLLS